jgi:multiple sugar transport system substrate-binding protein
MYTYSFIYRTDIYDRLGLSVPETWEELLENARIIDEDEETDARGFGIGGGKNLKASTHFVILLATVGGGRYRWKTEGEEAEVWLDEEHVTEVLEFANELAEYSLDPSSMTWTSSIENWVAGNLAQDFSLNAWAAGASYRANPEIGLNTGVALPPVREGADPLDRGCISVEGTPVIRNSTNPDGGKELWKFMHSDPDTIGETFLQEPMRFLPTYESVLESDTYTNAEFFQVEDGYFLDLNQKIIEEHVPQLASTERPQTPATLYADSYPYASDMMNAVLAQDRSPEEAYQQGLEEAENRLQEGKDRSAW